MIAMYGINKSFCYFKLPKLLRIDIQFQLVKEYPVENL
jgi:hypothetical protein